MTVRQTEQLVKKCLKPEVESGIEARGTAVTLTTKTHEKLQVNVSVTRSVSGKSKVTITLDEPHVPEQLIAKTRGLNETIDLGQLCNKTKISYKSFCRFLWALKCKHCCIAFAVNQSKNV